MPIAELFAALAADHAPSLPKLVGTDRDGRNMQAGQGSAEFRPAAAPVGTVGTERRSELPHPMCVPTWSDPKVEHSERAKAKPSKAVPSVPTVPTGNRRVGSWRGPTDPPPAPPTAPDPPRRADLPALPDPATAPIGRCRVCGWITPLSARRTCCPCSLAEPPATVLTEDPFAQSDDPPPWTNDRKWIRLWRTAGPALADRKPVVRAWLAMAPSQPLPRTLAAIELARIAAQHGLVVEVALQNAPPAPPEPATAHRATEPAGEPFAGTRAS
jgi:hypothetical protein